MSGLSRAALPFLLLYAALYAGFGVQSPYLPAWLGSRGMGAEAIALMLAAGTAVRIAAGPAAGRIADALAAPRGIFAGCAMAAALLALGYKWANGFWPLLAVAILQAAMLAPLAPLSDSLVLAAALPRGARGKRPGVDYGVIRGAGSAAFILGAVLAGAAAQRLGLAVILWLNAALLAAAAAVALRVPLLRRAPAPSPAPPRTGTIEALGALLRLPLFRRLMLAAALILGSHAFHDSFAVIRWRAAGIATGTTGLLWSESVAAEVVVFLFIGRWLLDRLGPARAAALAAAAGVVRWAVMAATASVPALAVVEPLHGITFALLHLAAMRLLAAIVPARLAATALTLYGTGAIGIATAGLTLASGFLYARIGAGGFWVMAALCGLALPLALTLERPEARGRC